MSYDVLLRCGRLVDPENGVDGPRDVAITDGRVVEVAERLDEAESSRLIDAGDRTVIPGIVDTHVHVGGFGGRERSFGHRMVAETGVTTVLDMGSKLSTLTAGMAADGAGLNVASLLSSTAAFGGKQDPGDAEIMAALEAEQADGAFGLKLLGGHIPLTPDATARCIEIANGMGIYVAFHLGTTESSSNLHGLRELPSLLGERGRLQVAHVAAYCRGMVEPPLRECEEAIAILGELRGRVVSESYLSTQVGGGNATSGHCDGDEVADQVTRNCLAMKGYEPTRVAMRKAILDGYCTVYVTRAGRSLLIGGEEAVEAWESAGTQIGVSFAVTPAESAVALMMARHEDGEFVIDALATDGGGIPRNWMVERGLAMVRLGAITLADYVRKASLNPARMLGLDRKGQLGVGADADVTVLDLDRGTATMALAGGRPIMVDGEVVGERGTLLVTAAGEQAALAAGLKAEVVDPARASMYRAAVA
jgi:cytosine/adenosine deaminase-related metal-dependent hydrolase